MPLVSGRCPGPALILLHATCRKKQDDSTQENEDFYWFHSSTLSFVFKKVVVLEGRLEVSSHGFLLSVLSCQFYALTGKSVGTHGEMVFLPSFLSWNCRSDTVMSRVNAKYPIWVFRQSFMAMSMSPRGSGRASPSQIWKICRHQRWGRRRVRPPCVLSSGTFAPGATWVPFV